MPKILAEKNKEKNTQGKKSKSTNKKALTSELVDSDLAPKKQTINKKNIEKPEIGEISLQDNEQDLNGKQSLNGEQNLNEESLEHDTFELLDSEDFDPDSSEDLLTTDNESGFLDDLIDNDYDHDFHLDEQKTYALDSYNHTNGLPALHTKNLPTTLKYDNLQLYIREISKFPLLTPEEELELSRRVRDENDSKAAFRIISSHLRLVVKVAMSFQRRWMQNVLDLIQEGNVGLMRAINKFDPDKGIKFSYYATFWVKAYILKFIMDNWRMVKIGTTQAQRKLFYNLNKERQKLISLGFDPDAKTLSEALGVSVDQVIEMQQRLNTSDMSLDVPVNDEHGSASKVDFFPALGPGVEDNYASTEIANLVQSRIATLLPQLSEKEVFILNNRLLTDDPITLREIGEKYNVTRERIRQLEARLLVKLRNHLGSEIKDFSESWIQN